MNYPGPSGNNNGGVGGGGAATPPFAYNIPPNPPQPSSSFSSLEKKDLNTTFIGEENNTANANLPPPSYESLSPDDNLQNSLKPKPQPRSKISPDMGSASAPSQMNLPNVPLDLPEIPNDDDTNNNNDDIDFDDLSRRFEELKRKK